jgi:hypothetical protein
MARSESDSSRARRAPELVDLGACPVEGFRRVVACRHGPVMRANRIGVYRAEHQRSLVPDQQWARFPLTVFRLQRAGLALLASQRQFDRGFRIERSALREEP